MPAGRAPAAPRSPHTERHPARIRAAPCAVITALVPAPSPALVLKAAAARRGDPAAGGDRPPRLQQGSTWASKAALVLRGLVVRVIEWRSGAADSGLADAFGLLQASPGGKVGRASSEGMSLGVAAVIRKGPFLRVRRIRRRPPGPAQGAAAASQRCGLDHLHLLALPQHIHYQFGLLDIGQCQFPGAISEPAAALERVPSSRLDPGRGLRRNRSTASAGCRRRGCRSRRPSRLRPSSWTRLLRVAPSPRVCNASRAKRNSQRSRRWHQASRYQVTCRCTSRCGDTSRSAHRARPRVR